MKLERAFLSTLKENRLNGQVYMVNEVLAVAARIGEKIKDVEDKDKTHVSTQF